MTTNDRKPNILDAFIDESIEEKPIWKPMHMQPVFKDSIFIKKARKITVPRYIKMVFAYHLAPTFLFQIKTVLLIFYYPLLKIINNFFLILFNEILS